MLERDHPRGCGAHEWHVLFRAFAEGSSPRVRGSHCRCFLGNRLMGIIPAGAGLTRARPTTSFPSRDHPRGCGAHEVGTLDRPPSMGSSPRVRGSHTTCLAQKTCKGIIPAGAGLTDLDHFIKEQLRDHPRGCGAHASRGWSTASRQGSSPRVRGSLLLCHAQEDGRRIIPAGAGLTIYNLILHTIIWDHPRGCGAHSTWKSARANYVGSSPRVRGSPLKDNAVKRASGIIPAGAGLTEDSLTSCTAQRDHPRGCGAHPRQKG